VADLWFGRYYSGACGFIASSVIPMFPPGRFARWQVLQRWLWLLQRLFASLSSLLVVDFGGGRYSNGACDHPTPPPLLQCFELLPPGIFYRRQVLLRCLQLPQVFFIPLWQNFELVGIFPPTSLSMPKMLPTLCPYFMLSAFQ
jgi:hypothetical protein